MEIKIKNAVFKKGRPQMAISLTGSNAEEIIEQCGQAVLSHANVIEWRVDYYLSAVENLEEKLLSSDIYLEIMEILEKISQLADGNPIIFTIRNKAQGGQIEMGEINLMGLQTFAAESGFVDLVDVEVKGMKRQFGGIGGQKLRDRVQAIHEAGAGVILSYHDFEEMIAPKEVVMLINAMDKYGGDMFKVAAMAHSAEDAKNMVRATEYLTKRNIGPVVTMAMGEVGVPTRIMGGKYGSVMTFAALGEGSAPGQLPAREMINKLDEFYGAR